MDTPEFCVCITIGAGQKWRTALWKMLRYKLYAPDNTVFLVMDNTGGELSPSNYDGAKRFVCETDIASNYTPATALRRWMCKWPEVEAVGARYVLYVDSDTIPPASLEMMREVMLKDDRIGVLSVPCRSRGRDTGEIRAINVLHIGESEYTNWEPPPPDKSQCYEIQRTGSACFMFRSEVHSIMELTDSNPPPHASEVRLFDKVREHGYQPWVTWQLGMCRHYIDLHHYLGRERGKLYYDRINWTTDRVADRWDD